MSNDQTNADGTLARRLAAAIWDHQIEVHDAQLLMKRCTPRTLLEGMRAALTAEKSRASGGAVSAHKPKVVEAMARAICRAVEFESPDDMVPYTDMFGAGMMYRWRKYTGPATDALNAIADAGSVVVPKVAPPNMDDPNEPMSYAEWIDVIQKHLAGQAGAPQS